MIEITRPAAPEKKINTSNDFELAYLRHQYLRRTKYNPTEEEMRPYMGITEHFSKNNYFTYVNLFRTVGIGFEDILSIGRVYLVEFLGLFALDRSEEKKKAFIDAFAWKNYKDPEEKDFADKNKAIYTLFLKQRMEDLVRVCRQKVRNIKGQNLEEFLVFAGPNKPPKFHRKLLRDHVELGYKKIDFSIFKSVRKKADVNGDATIFEFGGTWYVAIVMDQKPLSIEDIVGSDADPHQNEHNLQPEELFKEKQITSLISAYHGKSNDKKIKIIKKFIAKNRNSRHYRQEILTARKILKELEA